MGLSFSRNPKCELCDLAAGCRSVCIPTRPFSTRCIPAPAARKDRALLVIGEAPGFLEDQECRSWVGPPGDLLRKLYISDVFKFEEKVDVYLSNVVRCRPPRNDTPSKKQVKACLPYLLEDIRLLQSLYKELWILCCGATAASAMGFPSLKKALSAQGTTIVFQEPPVAQSI